MAENTRLKDLQADMKRMLEVMETCHIEYTGQRAEDSLRMDCLETALTALQQTNGGSNSFGSTPGFQPFQVRNPKLDFSRFDGIFKAEQFFEYYNTPDDQRLTIAATHLDKDVVPWYQMMSRANPFHSWVGFTRALEFEFVPTPYECPRSTLTQHASVNEYYVEFTALANRVQGISTDALLDCFLSGLKPEIRRDVLVQIPQKNHPTLSTLRFTGSIQGVKRQILLHCGSSDNFLQPHMAQFLRLPGQPAATFQVLVGNGNTLNVEGYIDDLQVLV